MNIPLETTERIVQTTDGSREIRYFTAVRRTGKVSRDQMVSDITRRYGIAAPQVQAVLSAVAEYLTDQTLEGRVVEVPFLGLFKVVVRAKTTSDARDGGEQAVTRVKMNFLPCRDIIKAIER